MNNLMARTHPHPRLPPLCVSLVMAMAGKNEIGGAVWRVYVDSSSALVHVHVHVCVHLQYPQNPSRSQFLTQIHSHSLCPRRTPSHNTQHQHQPENAQSGRNMAYQVCSRSQSRGYSRNCPLDPQIQVQVQEGRETSSSSGWVWGVLRTPSVLRGQRHQRGKKRRQSSLLIAVVLSLTGSRRRLRWEWRGCYRWYW